MSFPVVLKRLELRNFGVHSHLVIEEPSAIMLIVGPNGVGKTTIADALSLVLGGGSDRFQHLKDIASYRSGDESYVEVVLNNLVDSEGNYLLIVDPKYAQPRVTITLHLREKRVYWTVNGGRKHHNRKFVQRLLSSGTIKIDMQDEIYYTKKDTVDQFMSGSASTMFRQLLSPLNLADLRDEIEQLQEKVRGLKRKVPELSYRRDSLRRELERASILKQKYEEKRALKQELRELNWMLQWLEYQELERELQKLEEEYKYVEYNLRRLEEELNSRQDEFNELGRDKLQLHHLIQQNEEDQLLIQRKIDQLTERFGELKTKILSKREEYDNLLNLIEETQNLRTELLNRYSQLLESGEILGPENFTQVIRELEERKETADRELGDINQLLSELNRKKKKLEGVIKKISRDINLLEQEIEAESGFKITEGSNYWENERAALKLRRMVDEQSWGSSVTLPIFKEIYLTERGAELEGAVNYAIGENKAYLLARGVETLDKLRTLMERNRFRLSAAPVPHKLRKKPKVSRTEISRLPVHLREIVVATLEEVVEIDNEEIKSFIYEKVRVVFASGSAHYKELSELARRLQCDVVTPIPSVFKSDGSFKTHVNYSRSLATRRIDITKITQLEDRHQQLLSELPEIKLELQEVQEKMNQLLSENMTQTSNWTSIEAELKRVRRMDPRTYLVEIDNTSRRIEESRARLHAIEEERKLLESELSSLSKEPLIKELEEKKEEGRELQSLLEKLNRELYELDTVIEQKGLEIAQLRSLYTEKENLLVDTEARLREKEKELVGVRPDVLPDRLTLQNKIIEVETRIHMNPATEQDVRYYEDVKKEYEGLSDASEKLSQTLDETLEILEQHHKKWKHTVRTTIQKIQDTANYLLSPRLRIECRVINSLDMNDVGLEITFEDLTKVGKQDTEFKMGSGGEMALITQALFLALHTLHYDSPLHIIDEFSQRLDEENRGHALIMVTRILDQILDDQGSRLGTPVMIPQIFLIAPVITGSYIPEEIETTYLIKVKVLKAEVQ